MTSDGRRLQALGVVALACAFLAACEDSKQPTSNQGEAAGAAGQPTGDSAVGGEAAGSGAEPQARVGVHAAYEPEAATLADTPGSGGERNIAALIAPYGTDTGCGDAILGAAEECDDGAGGAADGCTEQCQTHDQPAAAPTGAVGSDRYLGAGRHPVAGNADQGFIASYVEVGEDEPAIGATLFDIWGKPLHRIVMSEGAAPLYDANPVAAGLPDGSYAVAWTDLDGDGSDSGIALRRVSDTGVLEPLGAANAKPEFSQRDPDMLWTGEQLVVAWVDFSNAATGPDLRYRIFDGDLVAQSSDLVLADSVLPEAAVALAPFNGSWAAAYREGLVDGSENIVVKVGDESFLVGPLHGGPIDDRPALAELDATHLLVAFSAGTDPEATGVYNLPRLRYAVIDTESVAAPQMLSLDPLDDIYSADNTVSQFSPAAVKGNDGAIYLAWRSEARPGDAAGDQAWLKRVSWDAQRETKLELREPEMLIPRICESSFGDQRAPALAPVALPPSGALAIAWDDYSRSQGVAAGEPDVVVHYAPLHARTPGGPQVVTETWTGSHGSPWSAQWTHVLTPSTTYPVTISANEGQVAWAQ